MPRRPYSTPETFWRHVRLEGAMEGQPSLADQPSDVAPCWHWTGSQDSRGRPLVWRGGRLRNAGRYCYELVSQHELAPDEELRSACRVVDCINPFPAHHVVVKRAPMRPFFQRRSKAALAFRLDLDNAALRAFHSGVDWYCKAGHPLKAGVKRGNCPGCQKERRHRRRSAEVEQGYADRASKRGVARGLENVLEATIVPITPTPEPTIVPYVPYSLDGFMVGTGE